MRFKQLILLWICLVPGWIAGAQHFFNKQDWIRIQDAHHRGVLKEDRYIYLVDSFWYDQLSRKQVSIPTDTLKQYLSEYKDILFRKNKTEGAVNYYTHLIDNALIGDRYGEAMFYVEKIDEAYNRLGQGGGLAILKMKMVIYAQKQDYRKIVSLYEMQKPALLAAPRLMIMGSNSRYNMTTLHMAAIILLEAGMAYAELEDTSGMKRLIEEDIPAFEKGLKASRQLKPAELSYMDNILKLADIRYAMLINRPLPEIERIVDTMSTSGAMNIGPFKQQVLRLKVLLYLHYKANDKAAEAIAAYKTFGYFDTSKNQFISAFDAALAENKGDYKTAYYRILETLKKSKQNFLYKSSEADEVMYIYAKEEDAREALSLASAQNRRRNIIIISLSVFMALSVGSLLWYYRNKRKKTDKLIADLNERMEWQITEMEQKYQEMRQQEQKRLGAELHDSLAARLAGIRNMFEVRRSAEVDTEKQSWWDDMSRYLYEAYQLTRGKSHEWFYNADQEVDLAFTNRVHQLVDQAFPATQYQKEINIDDTVLKSITIPARISILRIIQESVANIIKHAKAHTVTILVYEENGALVLTIADDGKGFNMAQVNRKSSIGLTSMRQRVAELNGHIHIQSGNKGTGIEVSIPLQAA